MARRDYGSGSIEPRGKNRWRVEIALAPDPLTGGRRRRRFPVRGTKLEAQRALREAQHERDNGGVDPNRITVAEWLSRWLERRIEDGAVGPRAAENYRAIVKRHLVPAVGSHRLQDLRSDQVIELKANIARTLAPPTVHKILGLLRQSLEAAVVGQLLSRNPAASVPSPSLAGVTRERRALDDAEIGELLIAATGTAYAVPLRFALATGARQSEILGARWSAIDLDRTVFVVERTLQHVAGEFRLLPPKTRNSRRAIELSAGTVATLKRHRAAQNEARLQLGSAWADLDLVFPDALGGFQHRRTFFSGFRRLVDASAIEDPATVNFHALRHTAASQWIKAGVDLLTVSRRLGHGSASFTMDVYGHLLSGQQRAAAEALDHLLA